MAVSLLSAFILAWTMERAHRKAIETDIQAAAFGRISAELTLPLDAFAAAGHLTPNIRNALEHVDNDARLFEYVSGIRIFRPSGQAVFPPDVPSEIHDVHLALASDNFLRVNRGTQIVAYAPYYTRNEQVYVIAIDFVHGQLGTAYARERTELFSVVGAVSAISFISLLALAAGASREIESRRREAQSTFVNTLSIMADVIDLRDPYTAGHSKRVAAYSRRLAIALTLPPRQVDVIENGALLHDIGKIGIRDAVLLKPGALDTEERRMISAHPSIGARLLGGISAMADIVPCVLHHHEKVDGSGYPDHLAGEDIPLGARLIAVADTFDAMTTDRPYRRALSIETAIQELARVAGTQLDERCVLVFADLVMRGEIIPPPSMAELEAARAAAERDVADAAAELAAAQAAAELDVAEVAAELEAAQAAAELDVADAAAELEAAQAAIELDVAQVVVDGYVALAGAERRVAHVAAQSIAIHSEVERDATQAVPEREGTKA